MYDLYCEFDAQKHKETYINYLEVLVMKDGTVVYAVPSHEMKLVEICCEKLQIGRDQLFEMCPREYWFDTLEWMCGISGCVVVWTEYVRYKDITRKQIETMEMLADMGLYKGEKKWRR